MRRTSSFTHRSVVIVGLLLLVGCSVGGDDAATTTSTTAAPPSTSVASTATSIDDTEQGSIAGCPDHDEVEAVLGGPVRLDRSGGSAMSGDFETSVSYGYSSCEIELVDGGQGSVVVSRVTSAEVDGEPVDGSVFPVLRDRAEADFDEDGFEALAELGADAYRDGREVVYRSGDVMVLVSVEVDGEDSFEAALDLAGALISSGLELPRENLDCRILDGIAPPDMGPVVDTSFSGRGSTVGDVTVEANGCVATHESGAESSVSVASAEVWDGWVRAKTDSVFTSTFTEVDVAGRSAFDDGDELVVDDGDQPLIIEASGDDLDPDPAAVRLAVAELVLAG